MSPAATTIASVPYSKAIDWATTFENVPLPDRPGRRNEVALTSNFIAIERDFEFSRHFAKLKAIETDQSLWPEGAEAPGRPAVYWASQVLGRLQDDMVRPDRVVASVEGGIAICVLRGKALYAYLLNPAE